jgi:YaiO family outer membrane protein
MDSLNRKEGSPPSNLPKARLTMAVVVVSLLIVQAAVAQIDTLKLSSEKLFSLARDKAFAGQRGEARRLCRIILARSPSYSDARILLGQTYAWDGRWDEARVEFRQVLDNNPSNMDALKALLDLEIWDERFNKALEIADRGLSSLPSDEDFLLNKARALKGLGRNREALLVLLKLEEINPSLAEIASLRRSIETTSMLNGAGVNYSSDRFSGVYDPMHYAYVQLSRWTAYGTIFARMNYSRRFGTSGVQWETDLYPRLGNGVYAYLNYGFSNSDLFPKHRAGAEIFTKLPSSYEGSLGFRHLYFGSSSAVTIYTGSFGYYFGNYWISFRPYFIPNDAGLAKSASLTLRRYLGDAENFITLRAGAGFSADERTIQSNIGFQGQEVFYLQSQTIGIGWQQSFATYFVLVATFDVTNQELGFSPGNYVVMYSSSLGVRVRF